jgi:hypothetical protein
MWPLGAPSKSVDSVLTACISNIANPTLKNNFAGTAQLLNTSEATFINAAKTNTLHQFPATAGVGVISRSQMIWLYNNKMAHAKSPGRAMYDEIKMAAPFGRCPLCGRGSVYTLDHHLPKAAYPDLCITPANLIPACQDCNKNKTQVAPQTCVEETLHPYFDNVDGDIWLRARIVEESPAAILFFVLPPSPWTATLAARVQNHFKLYKLKTLFASLAAEELSNIRRHLAGPQARSGKLGVRDHLLSIAASHRSTRLNTWQAAAYSAMADSDWFCEGGFALSG